MGTNKKSMWWDDPWNPVIGCKKVSPACANCYAESMGHRIAGMGNADYAEVVKDGHWTGKVKLLPGRMDQPVRWKKPRRIFVCNMSDLFHPDVPDEFIDDVFTTMSIAQQHTYLVLTKRAERMFQFVTKYYQGPIPSWAWLGVTAENQEYADERIPWLLQTPAAVRFVSVEPMLGAINIDPYLHGWHSDPRPPEKDPGIDWVIAGGESGVNARPCHPEWARNLRDQCVNAGTAFYWKQWGEWLGTGPFDPKPMEDVKSYEWNGGYSAWRVGKKAAGCILDGREWKQFPGDK